MNNEYQDEISPLMEYVKSTQLKGSVDLGEDCFWWDLGRVRLHFVFDNGETTVEYFHKEKNKISCVGHFHLDNSDVKEIIEKINGENNIVLITSRLLGSQFDIIQKSVKEKKSWFLVSRYYSI